MNVRRWLSGVVPDFVGELAVAANLSVDPYSAVSVLCLAPLGTLPYANLETMSSAAVVD